MKKAATFLLSLGINLLIPNAHATDDIVCMQTKDLQESYHPKEWNSEAGRISLLLKKHLSETRDVYVKKETSVANFLTQYVGVINLQDEEFKYDGDLKLKTIGEKTCLSVIKTPLSKPRTLRVKWGTSVRDGLTQNHCMNISGFDPAAAGTENSSLSYTGTDQSASECLAQLQTCKDSGEMLPCVTTGFCQPTQKLNHDANLYGGRWKTHEGRIALMVKEHLKNSKESPQPGTDSASKNEREFQRVKFEYSGKLQLLESKELTCLESTRDRYPALNKKRRSIEVEWGSVVENGNTVASCIRAEGRDIGSLTATLKDEPARKCLKLFKEDRKSIKRQEASSGQKGSVTEKSSEMAN